MNEINEQNKELIDKLKSASDRIKKEVPENIRNLIELMKYGRIPPEIHTEFPLPSVIRASTKLSELAHSVLYRGFLTAQSHPWLIGWSMAEDKYEAEVEANDFYIRCRYEQNRWNVADRKRSMKVDYLSQVVFHPDTLEPMLMDDIQRERVHFSNAPCFPNPQSPSLGPTHVALAFTDLQVLLPNSTDLAMKPMRFIGYDRCSYSIAKTLVLAHMLLSVDVQPHHIVEAWYSSTWSNETLQLFRASCVSILSESLPSTIGPTVVRDEVHGYLDVWAHRAVPKTDSDVMVDWFLKSCRSGFSYMQTCNFHRKQDRNDLLHYFMTGEFGLHCFGQDSSPAREGRVASLAMFSVPYHSPLLNEYEQDLVGTTILMQTIMDELDTNSNVSIMEAIYNVKVRQVHLLQEGVQSGVVQLDLRYGDIQPWELIDRRLWQEIIDLKADSISWFNLLDYLQRPENVHELAHAWSTTSTKHYGYSKNWPTTCKGFYIEDYKTGSTRRRILKNAIEGAIQDGKKSGVDRLMTLPSYDSPTNVTGYHLCNQMRSTWVEKFRSGAQSVLQENGTSLVIQNDMLHYSPLLRSCQSVYLSWQYSSS